MPVNLPITPVYVNTIPEQLEQNKLYISLPYKTATHLCLCGCGHLTITPINDGYGWRLLVNNDKVSLTPGISNFQFDCKSKYNITNNIGIWL